MISFLAESEEEAVELVARTKIFKLAESLGGVESLIEHPARMTHASTADAPFAAPRNLVRLSVGIESADDLIADLEAALVQPPRASERCYSAPPPPGARIGVPRVPVRRRAERPRSVSASVPEQIVAASAAIIAWRRHTTEVTPDFDRRDRRATTVHLDDTGRHVAVATCEADHRGAGARGILGARQRPARTAAGTRQVRLTRARAESSTVPPATSTLGGHRARARACSGCIRAPFSGEASTRRA